MPSVTVSEHIAAPREKVFALLTDLKNLPEHVSGIDSTEVLTDGPVGVGTTFRETRTMMGKQATEEMTFSVFDPPGGYTLTAASCGSRYVTSHTLTEKDGGTELSLTFSATPESFFAKLMSVLSGLMMSACRKAIAGDLADIKAAAEKAADA